jgi:hypothetical protein
MHVHVYVTLEKYEFDIKTNDRTEALQTALQLAKSGNSMAMASETRYLAMIPEEKGLKMRLVQSS